MNVNIMVMCDASAAARCELKKKKGFPMHYSTLTEISTI